MRKVDMCCQTVTSCFIQSYFTASLKGGVPKIKERHCFKLHCIHIASGSKTLRRDFSLFYRWLVNLAQINSFSSSPVVTSKNLSPFRVFNLPSSFTISCRPRLKNTSYVLLFLFLFFLLTSSTATFSLSSKFVSAVYTKIKRTFKQLAHDEERKKVFI